MKILIIGGTRFLGPFVVKRLLEEGHTVVVFHRGESEADLPAQVEHIHGDQMQLAAYRDKLAAFSPDVVIAMHLYDKAATSAVCQAIQGITSRFVVVSSMDVYRAFGRLTKTEPGPPVSIPLTENSPLREKPLAENYEKIDVEDVVMNQKGLAGTVVRLPMVYGPGDGQHRLFEHLKRMDDGRSEILLDQKRANNRASRGYVENMADAIALAATKERAAGQIYHVAEEHAFTEREWAEAIGSQVGWRGRVVAVPGQEGPSWWQTFEVDWDQLWVVDSTKIRGQLGYVERVPSEEGLKRTVAWERANPPEINPDKFDYAEEDKILAKLGLA